MAALLKGTAFITGAASGIGRATAVSFAKYGIARLALADISKENLTSSIDALKKQYPHVECLPLLMDVRKNAEIKSGLAETVKTFGRLDVAVNNAGIAGSGLRTDELEDEETDNILAINLHGVYRCQKEELSIMVKQEDLGPREGRGRIINVSSIFGIVSPEYYNPQTAYTTAKHGVMGLTKGDANAYGELGVRLNAVCPGYVETPLLGGMFDNPEPESVPAKELDRMALKRIAQPDEIGDAISFLASPLASYMQGAALIVDGGYTSG